MGWSETLSYAFGVKFPWLDLLSFMISWPLLYQNKNPHLNLVLTLMVRMHFRRGVGVASKSCLSAREQNKLLPICQTMPNSFGQMCLTSVGQSSIEKSNHGKKSGELIVGTFDIHWMIIQWSRLGEEWCEGDSFLWPWRQRQATQSKEGHLCKEIADCGNQLTRNYSFMFFSIIHTVWNI